MRNGSQPSAISPVKRTIVSVPVPSQTGMFGFMCRMDFNGLPMPSAPSPMKGNEISRPSWLTISRRNVFFTMAT